MTLTPAKVAAATGGRLVPGPQSSASGEGEATISGAAIDSRNVRQGNLFAALSGEHLDGHDFVDEAFRNGASAALVERQLTAFGPQVVVPGTAAALSKLAAWVRDEVDPIVVAITGSTGKTSTKNLLASIGSRKYATVASPFSYNTELTVPVALLQIDSRTELVVCELGARGPGQIAALCEIARPHAGIVTNVGLTHHEQFGSQEAIASAKAELVSALGEGETAILNCDDPLVAGMSSLTRASTVTFGVSPGAEVRAEKIQIDEMGRPTFRLVHEGEGAWVTLSMSGRHQVMNAAAACAAARSLGISMEECRQGLEAARGEAWRMEVRSSNGIKVVNDAYNASPASTAAALETASEMVAAGGRLIAVLGYMAELGEIEAREHVEIGRQAAARAARLVCVSERAAAIASGAREAGMKDIVVVPGAEDVMDAIGQLEPADVVLVKASRAAGLENLAEQILSKAARQ